VETDRIRNTFLTAIDAGVCSYFRLRTNQPKVERYKPTITGSTSKCI